MAKIISTNGPCNFALTLRRYQAFGEDAANAFDGRNFRKVFKVRDKLYLLSLQEQNGDITLEV